MHPGRRRNRRFIDRKTTVRPFTFSRNLRENGETKIPKILSQSRQNALLLPSTKSNLQSEIETCGKPPETASTSENVPSNVATSNRSDNITSGNKFFRTKNNLKKNDEIGKPTSGSSRISSANVQRYDFKEPDMHTLTPPKMSKFHSLRVRTLLLGDKDNPGGKNEGSEEKQAKVGSRSNFLKVPDRLVPEDQLGNLSFINPRTPFRPSFNSRNFIRSGPLTSTPRLNVVKQANVEKSGSSRFGKPNIICSGESGKNGEKQFKKSVRDRQPQSLLSLTNAKEKVLLQVTAPESLSQKRKLSTLTEERKRPKMQPEIADITWSNALKISSHKKDTDLDIFMKLLDEVVDELGNENVVEQEQKVLKKFYAVVEEEIQSKIALIDKYNICLKKQRKLSNIVNRLSDEVTRVSLKRLQMEHQQRKFVPTVCDNKNFIEKMEQLLQG